MRRAVWRCVAGVRRVVLVTGKLPWLLGILALAPFVALPQTRATLLVAAAVAGGVILLLATSSNWRASRGVAEWLGLVVAFHAILVVARSMPWRLQIAVTPILMLAASIVVFALAEWRYAPDCGQTGWTWSVDRAVRPALGVAFGIGVVLPWIAALLALPVERWVVLLLFAVGALAGRAIDLIGQRLCPRGACVSPARLDPDEPGDREFDLAPR